MGRCLWRLMMSTLVLLLGLLATAVDLMATLALLLGLLAVAVDLVLTLVVVLGLLAMVVDLMLTLVFLLRFLGLLDLSATISRERGYYCRYQSHASDVPPWMRVESKRRRLGTEAGSSCDHLFVQGSGHHRPVPVAVDHVTLPHARILSLLWTQMQVGCV